METHIDGIIHFGKLMDINIPKKLKEVSEEYLKEFNYYRDSFSNVYLLRQVHDKKVIAYQFENGKIYIEDKD